MADIHHDPSHRNVHFHNMAATIIGIALLGYAILMAGQALGLYIL